MGKFITMMYKCFMIAVIAPFAQLHCSSKKDDKDKNCKATDEPGSAKYKFKPGVNDQTKTKQNGAMIDDVFCQGLYVHQSYAASKLNGKVVECKNGKADNILAECKNAGR